MAPCLGRLSRTVFVVTGSVLLAAAVLKGIQLAGDPLDENELLPNRTVAILAVFLEAVLGAWLVTGIFPRTARTIGALCFFVFCVVSTRHALIGRSSCGCFGQIQVTPWLTAMLDVVSAVMLAIIRPPAVASWSWLLAWVAGTIGVVTILFTWGLLSPNPDMARLVASPAIVDLGTIDRGQELEFGIRLSNNSRKQIRLHSFETSCPCLCVRLAEATVDPGQTIQVAVTLDLTKEPDFVGMLGMTAKGLSSDGEQVSQFLVTAEVRNR